MATIRRWGQKPSLGSCRQRGHRGLSSPEPSPHHHARDSSEWGKSPALALPQRPLPRGGLLCRGPTAPWAQSVQVWTASARSLSLLPEPGVTRGAGAGGWASAGASSLAPVSGATRASEAHSPGLLCHSRRVEATAGSLRPWGPQAAALPQVSPGTAAPPPASRGRHAATVCARGEGPFPGPASVTGRPAPSSQP